jgi:hypothetical protein
MTQYMVTIGSRCDQRMSTEMSESIQRAIASGDVALLGGSERAAYYHAVCESLGLNPRTRPLDFLELNGRVVLYAKRDATDQLRHKHHVSVEIINRPLHADVYTVRARATMPDGRTDESTGAVSIVGLAGESLANALMKAETKAKPARGLVDLRARPAG